MKPWSTYRIQFRREFPFAAAKDLAPYLAKLGVTHLYASPITTARQGSAHGYDVVDPTRVNPELGGEDGFRDMVEGLRAHGLGVIVDIVPNHMAVGGDDNPWWLDMLEGGEHGPLSAFFDVDWRPDDPSLAGKVLAPFLGTSYAEALAAGDITLRWDGEDSRLSAVTGGTNLFPIRREDYGEALAAGPEGLHGRYDAKTPDGRARLHALLERQHFRLASWRTAGDEINWRRFFDVTELAGLRTDRPEVFQVIHAKIFALYAEGLIDGVRADHVDGLADPVGYCRSLRLRLSGLEPLRPKGAAAGPALFVVEKILSADERLSPSWRTDGTTGYDYMELASALLHDERGARVLTDAWTTLSGRPAAFAQEARTARAEILGRHFAGQLDAAARAFWRLAQARLETRDITFGSLRRVLTNLLIVFPCYRTYAGCACADEGDPERIETALFAARPLTSGADRPVLERVGLWLRGEDMGEDVLFRTAVRRFQQLSSPVAAKAVEDTAFYRYSRLLSRNDVGFDPGRFALPVSAFHASNQARAATFPRALLATATHDHKRGEDVRARLAVLSELPEAWVELEAQLRSLGEGVRDGVAAADLYAIHQTLLGAAPFTLDRSDADGLRRLGERLAGWLQKALREAKLRSSWSDPDADYEGRCQAYLSRILEPEASEAFLEALFAFRDRIAPASALNGVTQSFLRCLSPGTPDLYQGAETWDLSLVDPDNRRPVDYPRLAAVLDDASPRAVLWARWREGGVKAHVIADALKLRAAAPEAFAGAAYTPLEIRGARAGNVIAFTREGGGKTVLVAAALRCAAALEGASSPVPPAAFWSDTAIVAPRGPRAAKDVSLQVATLFADAPVAGLILDGGASPCG